MDLRFSSGISPVFKSPEIYWKLLTYFVQPPLCSQFYEEQASEYARQDADSGTGHGNIHCIRIAQSLERGADRCSRSMSSGKSGCQEKPESIINVRKQFRYYKD